MRILHDENTILKSDQNPWETDAGKIDASREGPQISVEAKIEVQY